MINREDILELTRRMTPTRTCFDRIAGAYISETGEIEACAAGKTMVRAYAPNGVCGELIVRVR